MKTMESRTKKALELWATLPKEQQDSLLTACKKEPPTFRGVPIDIGKRAIQLDTTGEKPAQVVSILGIDIDICSPFVYLWPDDIPAEEASL